MRKTITDWGKYIQKNCSYAKYKEILNEYEIFLKTELEKNPRNTEYISHLAFIYNELGYNGKKIFKLLKKFLEKYKNELLNSEKERLFQNLAYYYYEYYYRFRKYRTKKKCLNLLKKVIKLNRKNSMAYYFLGVIYYKSGHIKKALNYYEKSYILGKNKYGNYNYALALMNNKEFEKSKRILEKFMEENWGNIEDLVEKKTYKIFIYCL